jgi:hypothetical protein
LYVKPAVTVCRVELEEWVAASPPQSFSAGLDGKITWSPEITYGDGKREGENGNDSAGFDIAVFW